MLKINYMSTLFVGIDVSSKTNSVYAMDFEENRYISSSFGNNQPGADKLVNMIAECMREHKNLDTVLIVLESTSVYSVHISNFLSTSEVLMPYKPYVFCVNPKATSNYRKSYIGMEKTDPADAYLIADFGRVGRTKKLEPWRGGQFIALKRLTRHRMYLSECITREKTYMVSNLYLKFSELQLLEGDDKPFGSLYGATSSAVLTEFLSPQEIIDMPEEDLLAFLAEKSRNRISDISKTSELLRKAKMSKAGNPYLRYYLGEAANSVRKHIPEYADFYARKYAEVTKHQHKRALALTSRKFVRLVFGLLVKNQLYTGEKLDTEYNIVSN